MERDEVVPLAEPLQSLMLLEVVENVSGNRVGGWGKEVGGLVPRCEEVENG